MSTLLSMTLPDEAALVNALRSVLRGPVIARNHEEYDTARRVWNGIIDRRPAVIARCLDTADVAAAVRVARELRPEVSIRGGGHQIAGSAVCDDGLVIDLSLMRNVEVDASSRVARAQGGATWGEVDGATQPFGLATPGGEVSTTGVAGFTLGGGMGLVMRRHGLACDNVRSFEVVTADGRVRTASRTEHPDLFWALRGGGRGVGVVTSFEFELHEVGPDVDVVQAFYPYDQAAEIMRRWRHCALEAPDTVTPQLLLWSVPPDPSVPAELHGMKTVVVIGVFCGPAGEGTAALAPLRSLGTPLFELTGTFPYLAIQSSVDELFPAGGRYYMKSHFMDLSDDAIDVGLAHDARRPPAEVLIAIRTMGGAVARVAPHDSAYAHRAAKFNYSIDLGWTDPARDAENVAWARGMWNALQPHADGGVYINFSGYDEEAEELRGAVYGDSAARLAAARADYDPDGVFAGAALRP
jgi:FAD/FMN-containing dehydrogenase